jgi:phospholipase/carboxylesterase
LKLAEGEAMTEKTSQSIELLPEAMPAKQLFILLHGVGSKPSDLVPLANYLKETFPSAAFFLPEGTEPFDGGGNGRQWFSISGVSDVNRISRVANAMPDLHALVKDAQDRFNVLQSDTALIGFSQGAIMALEFCIAHDGGVGRVLAFAGRFAQLPEKAPELTTLHLLHGENDPVIPVKHAEAALAKLKDLNGDATLDIAALAGHEINAELADHAIRRLQTHIPLRSWKKAMEGA